MDEGGVDGMHLRLGLRTIIAPILVIAIALGIGWWANGRAVDTRSALTSALDALPAETAVAGFTDWSAIRHDLGLGAGSTAADRAALTDDAALRDLTTRSVLGQSIDEMHELYGWSAADLDWESYGRATGGAVMVARLSRHVSIDDVRARLTKLGYSHDGDVWALGDKSANTVGPAFAATLGSLALLPRERLIIAADSPSYASTALETIRGRSPSLLSVRPAADVATELVGSDTALIQAGAFSCRSTSLQEQDADVLAQARAAVARVGALATPTFTGRGLTDEPHSQSIRFVMSFESPAIASAQLRVRSVLATGPFIGRTGRVEDSLRLVTSEVRGSVATLRFDLDPDRGAYMTGEGPLLFASCP